MPEAGPDHLDATFLALTDRRRRAMIARLCRDPASVSDLAGPLDLRLPAALKHLALLEAGGLVASEKRGRIRIYSLTPCAFDTLTRWIAAREASPAAAIARRDATLGATLGVLSGKD